MDFVGKQFEIEFQDLFEFWLLKKVLKATKTTTKIVGFLSIKIKVVKYLQIFNLLFTKFGVINIFVEAHDDDDDDSLTLQN